MLSRGAIRFRGLHVQARAVALLAAVVLSGACAPASQRAKGRLAPLTGVRDADIEKHLRGRRLALLVGVNYFDDASAWHPLRFAESDASRMADFLSSPSGGGFDEVLLLNSPETTRLGDMKTGLQRLRALNTRPNDTVLVYISSHGTLDRGPNGVLQRYVVTRETSQDDIAGTSLAVTDLLDTFDALPSRRKVAIFAFCHSGRGKSSLAPRLRQELESVKGAFFAEPLQAVSEASMVLSASAWGETAREDDGLQQDIYTHFFLQALEQRYDLDGDGAVTSSEAHDYAREKTYAFTGGRQRPAAVSNVLGADPIVLAGSRSRPTSALLMSFDDSLDGVAVAVNGRSKGSLPGIVPLDPGANTIRLSRAGTTIVEQELSLVAGERLDAGALIDRAGRRSWELSLVGGAAGTLASEQRPLFGAASPRLDFCLTVDNLAPMRVGVGLGTFSSTVRENISGLWFDERVLGLTPRLLAAFGLLAGPRLQASFAAELGFLWFARFSSRALTAGEEGQALSMTQSVVSPLFGLSLTGGTSISEHLNFVASLRAGYFFVRLESDASNAETIHALQLSFGAGLAWGWW